VISLIRIAERCVIVCGGLPSPMQSIAVAFDGGDTSRRALERAVQFATVAGSTVHLIHASDDREAGLQVVGVAEATLSMQRVAFVTHVESGKPGEVVARVIKRIRCDALFAGAHMSHSEGRPSAVVVSHAEEILRHTDIRWSSSPDVAGAPTGGPASWSTRMRAAWAMTAPNRARVGMPR